MREIKELTNEEKNYLFGLVKVSSGAMRKTDLMRCPDCGDTNQFLAGPRGGMAQNIMCKTCKSKFNVTLPWFAERI